MQISQIGKIASSHCWSNKKCQNHNYSSFVRHRYLAQSQSNQQTGIERLLSQSSIITILLFIHILYTGMVTIISPNSSVCYMSSPVLQCTFEETTDSAGWNMSRLYQRFELNSGSVVELDYNCATPDYNSCMALTLQKVTGAWAGKCRDFTQPILRK